MSEIPNSNWSETANSNNAATPDGWPEGQAPSTVNNCAREMMAAIKREWNRNNATVTGSASATAMTLTYTTAPPAYVQGMRFTFIAGATNTGTCTLNVNSLGAKNIFADNRALAGGEIQSGFLVEVQYDGTQFQIISRQAALSLPYGFKNAVINPDFKVQQRDAGGALSMSIAASTTAYTFDRWALSTGANQASSVFQTGGSGFTSQTQYAAVIQRNNGQTGTGAMLFQQPMTLDQLVTLRGKIVTLSFKALAGATFPGNNGNLSYSFITGTGSEGKFGTFTGNVSVIGSSVALTTSVQSIVATSAAVVPTNATQACILFNWTPTATAGATDQVILADVQLEVGGVATSFDRRPFDVELARCQRFFAKSFAYSTAPAQNVGTVNGAVTATLPTGGTGLFSGMAYFPSRMRVIPTVTTYNPSATNANWRDATNSADRTVSQATLGEGNMTFSATGGVAGSIMSIHWLADADL